MIVLCRLVCHEVSFFYVLGYQVYHILQQPELSLVPCIPHKFEQPLFGSKLLPNALYIADEHDPSILYLLQVRVAYRPWKSGDDVVR